jgi:hypothetical protein
MAAWLAVALATGLHGPWSLNPAPFLGGIPVAVPWAGSQEACPFDQVPPAASKPGIPQSAVPQDSRPRPAVPLQCRRPPGPWRACRLTIVSLGRHWWLQVGPDRWVLRADGRGALTLQDGRGPARPVQPRWQADRSLCWNGHCLKGDFPLD